MGSQGSSRVRPCPKGEGRRGRGVFRALLTSHCQTAIKSGQNSKCNMNLRRWYRRVRQKKTAKHTVLVCCAALLYLTLLLTRHECLKKVQQHKKQNIMRRIKRYKLCSSRKRTIIYDDHHKTRCTNRTLSQLRRRRRTFNVPNQAGRQVLGGVRRERWP